MPPAPKETSTLTESTTPHRVPSVAALPASPVADPWFADALAGPDGTADAPQLHWRTEVFADPLVIVARSIGRPTEPVTPGAAHLTVRPAAPTAPNAAAPATPAAVEHAAAARSGWSPNPQWAPPQRWAGPQQRRQPPVARAAAAPPIGIAPRTTSYAVGRPTLPTPRGRLAEPARPTALPARPARIASTARMVGSARGLPTPARRRSAGGRGGAWTFIVVVLFFLVMSGAGRQILDALIGLLNR